MAQKKIPLALAALLFCGTATAAYAADDESYSTTTRSRETNLSTESGGLTNKQTFHSKTEQQNTDEFGDVNRQRTTESQTIVKAPTLSDDAVKTEQRTSATVKNGADGSTYEEHEHRYERHSTGPAADD